MNKLTKSILGSTTVAGLATLAPLSIEPGAVASGGSPIRLAQACSQSTTSCQRASGYACVTVHGILYDWKCATGCGS